MYSFLTFGKPRCPCFLEKCCLRHFSVIKQLWGIIRYSPCTWVMPGRVIDVLSPLRGLRANTQIAVIWKAASISYSCVSGGKETIEPSNLHLLIRNRYKLSKAYWRWNDVSPLAMWEVLNEKKKLSDSYFRYYIRLKLETNLNNEVISYFLVLDSFWKYFWGFEMFFMFWFVFIMDLPALQNSWRTPWNCISESQFWWE